MPIKLNSAGGGSVTLTTPSTGSTYTLTVPATTANLVPDLNPTISGALTINDDTSSVTTVGRYSSGYPWSIFRPTGSSSGLEFRDNAGNMMYQIDQTNNRHSWYTTSGTERMRIDSSGNIGFGVSTLTYKMELTSPNLGNPTAPNGLRISMGGGLDRDQYSLRLYTAIDSGGAPYSQIRAPKDNNGYLAFLLGSSDTERMRIDSSGNLMLGTTTARALATFGQNNLTGMGIEISNLNSANNTTKMAQIAFSGYDTVGAYKQTAFITTYPVNANYIDSFMVFNTRYGDAIYERMRINNTGNIWIGTTYSGFTSRLAVMAVSGQQSINCGDAQDGSYYGSLQVNRPASQPDNAFHIAFIRSGQNIAGMGFLQNSNSFAIQNSGNNAGSGVTLGQNATSWGTTSDERKKNILGNIENALDKLSLWRTVYFNYLIDDKDQTRRIGLIAQDVVKTVPEAISVGDDEDKTLELKYTETIPVLVKAIQELKAELDAAKAEIEILKNK